MNAKRAMTSKHASKVKTAGHQNEDDFASLIGGYVPSGKHTNKVDVIDEWNRSYSVRAGTWWQLFLYRKDGIKTSPISQNLKNVADIMIECLECFPETWEEYLANEHATKTKLTFAMQKLLLALHEPNVFPIFLEKSIFGNDCEFLSFHLGQAADPIEKKEFHIYHKDDVVKSLSENIELNNSRKRAPGQYDAQKVTAYSIQHEKIMGEIEERHDGEIHYQEMKFRLNAEMVSDILAAEYADTTNPYTQIYCHGKARQEIK